MPSPTMKREVHSEHENPLHTGVGNALTDIYCLLIINNFETPTSSFCCARYIKANKMSVDEFALLLPKADYST